MSDIMLPRTFPGGHLRRLHTTDLAAFQAYRSIPELGRYQGWSPMTTAKALEFIDEMHHAPLFAPGQWVQLGIAEPASDVLIGDIGLYLSADGSYGEIGFTLQPSAQGRGIASLAVREALDLLFTATGITRVLGITDVRNRPSIRLLERLGFELIERRDVLFRDEPCTESVYALARHSGSPLAQSPARP
ncbi:RimJ/RimL family protein N-acetyltransferase [Chitinivorax tropicus]|uniref:RimJ/RimL family protein N-acetyltransferase n=1 Tax=Chitinivorax tropicus TaxID=714531 RepID=A0A840MRS7_9PROT|nr:GNAT family N-acetyltransferase [Chitinivorax tropicus]MBB5019817.1 RimJ/RimL family protein N-acetyltransferase [Chitinivorax tropicus]